MDIQLALAAVRLSVARPFVKGWNKNGVGVKAVRKFLPKRSKGYRLYMPIKKTKADKVIVPAAVFHEVKGAGYKVEDYINGIAVTPDGKRRIRIGKLLKDAEAVKAFANDPQRSAHKDDYTCVISCHPYDVIGMSTGRRWDFTTCMRLATPENKGKFGERAHFMKGTVAEGTLVAYVISPKDKNIDKPHARLLMKPYKKLDEPDHVYFKVETHVYGQPIPGFKRTVENWLKRVNKGAEAGIYKLSDDVHIDGGDDMRTAIMADYDKVKDKAAFIQKNMFTAGGPKTWLHTDKRWLPDMIKATTDVHNLYEILSVAREFFKPKQIGEIYDSVIGPDDAVSYDLTDYLMGTYSQDLFKTSKVLGAVAEEQYAWSDYDTNPNHAMNYGRYDSRWLANAEEISGDLLRKAAQTFVFGGFKWTQELQDSKRDGARRIRLYFAFIAHALLADTGFLTSRVKVANLRNFVKMSKIPAGWDEEIVDIVREVQWMHNIQTSTTNSVSPYACVLNAAPDWAAVHPDWIPEARKHLSEKSVAVIAKMAAHNKDVQAQLVYWAYDQNRSALGHGYSWFRTRKNVREFIRKTAASKTESDAKTYSQRILDTPS